MSLPPLPPRMPKNSAQQTNSRNAALPPISNDPQTQRLMEVSASNSSGYSSMGPLFYLYIIISLFMSQTCLKLSQNYLKLQSLSFLPFSKAKASVSIFLMHLYVENVREIANKDHFWIVNTNLSFKR